MDINVNAAAKTITRNGQTWTFAETGIPNFWENVTAKYGEEMVAAVLTEGDYYPPMINRQERLEIEERLSAKFVSASFHRNPLARALLEKFGYSAEEAAANK